MDTRKVALVTGGMGSLGTSICQRLHADGFQVATTFSPRNDNAQLWLQEQRDAGFQFDSCQVDVADYDSCAEGVRNILGGSGRIDVLVNNAGIVRDGPLGAVPLDKWHMVLRTDLDSVFNMTKQVIDGMMDRGWGRIINISSVDAQRGMAGRTGYAAAKAAMHGFTKALALEVARKGVTVNTVSPGYLRTSAALRVSRDVMENTILPGIPAGRLGEPREVAGLISYLCSDIAGFLTGANLAINGGQHLF